MPTLYGRTYTREEFLRFCPNFGEIAGITPLTFEGGRARGSRALLVRTGGGLELTLLPDRCLDVLSMRYRGVNLSYASKNGPTDPRWGLPVPGLFPAAVSGGMLFTCGLLNAGPESEEDGRYHPAHGCIGLAPAEQLSYGGRWEGDEYLLEISGRMRESSLFGPHLTLTRQLRVRLGQNEVELVDTVENMEDEAVDYALLYHFNYGFPFLGPDTRLCLPENRVIPRTEWAAEGLARADVLEPPLTGWEEQVFFREMQADARGQVTVRAENGALGIASSIRYEQAALPEFAQWKSMRAGDYALGLEPANNRLRGRAAERASGALPTLPPFGRVQLRLWLSAEDL